MGMYYQEDEVKFSGDQVYYEYEGGSGGNMKMGFCPKCYVRVSARPEILEGVVGMPLGTFDKAKEVEGLKLEIWTSEKLKFMKKAMRRYGSPNEIVTDKLRSYSAAAKELGC
jgi:hypothetical protein